MRRRKVIKNLNEAANQRVNVAPTGAGQINEPKMARRFRPGGKPLVGTGDGKRIQSKTNEEKSEERHQKQSKTPERQSQKQRRKKSSFLKIVF